MNEKKVEKWELAIARRRVNEAQNRWEILRAEPVKDLVQECLLHWIQKKEKYDPERGASIKTFMAAVVSRRLSDIRDELSAKKRRPLFEVASLDEKFDEESDSSSDQNKHEPSEFFDPAIQIDVSIAFQKLTPQQKELCRLIGDKGLSFNQAGQQLKRHHREITREIERIRNVFEKQGLRGYLK